MSSLIVIFLHLRSRFILITFADALQFCNWYFYVSCTPFQLGTLIPQLAAKWLSRRTLGIANSYFTIPRHPIYKNIFSVLELIVGDRALLGTPYNFLNKNNFTSSFTLYKNRVLTGVYLHKWSCGMFTG